MPKVPLLGTILSKTQSHRRACLGLQGPLGNICSGFRKSLKGKINISTTECTCERMNMLISISTGKGSSREATRIDTTVTCKTFQHLSKQSRSKQSSHQVAFQIHQQTHFKRHAMQPLQVLWYGKPRQPRSAVSTSYKYVYKII